MNEVIEWLDLVNEQDEVVGEITRADAVAQGVPVRVVNAFLHNAFGQLWIPRRSLNKRAFPGGLDCSMGGYVGRGESYEQAFIRELAEELNLDAATLPWRLIATFSPHEHGVSNFMQVFELRTASAPDFNPGDFSDAEWIMPDLLLARLDAGELSKDDLPKLVRRLYTAPHRS